MFQVGNPRLAAHALGSKNILPGCLSNPRFDRFKIRLRQMSQYLQCFFTLFNVSKSAFLIKLCKIFNVEIGVNSSETQLLGLFSGASPCLRKRVSQLSCDLAHVHWQQHFPNATAMHGRIANFFCSSVVVFWHRWRARNSANFVWPYAKHYRLFLCEHRLLCLKLSFWQQTGSDGASRTSVWFFWHDTKWDTPLPHLNTKWNSKGSLRTSRQPFRWPWQTPLVVCRSSWNLHDLPGMKQNWKQGTMFWLLWNLLWFAWRTGTMKPKPGLSHIAEPHVLDASPRQRLGNTEESKFSPNLIFRKLVASASSAPLRDLFFWRFSAHTASAQRRAERSFCKQDLLWPPWTMAQLRSLCLKARSFGALKVQGQCFIDMRQRHPDTRKKAVI